MSNLYKIVEITNKNSKYYGDMAVIWNETASRYDVRSLNETPTLNRFIYNGNKVIGTHGKYKTYSVAKSSVIVTNRKKKINVNDYMDETSKLLKDNAGLTKTQIKHKYS